MAQNTIETTPSLPDVLTQNIKFVRKGEYELDLPSSFSFGPIQNYFTETHREYNQPDVLTMQWQFFRLLFPSIATLRIKDIHLGKSSSTILVTISQKGKECMMGLTNVRRTSRNGASGVRTEERARNGCCEDCGCGVWILPSARDDYFPGNEYEIKKLLPPGGTMWLFMRAQAKEIKDGRLSMEVMLFDEGMELVALSQQLCPIIDLSRAMANKQKL
ncbi:hypothetical protein BPAE_0065g00050 [Botrytis paeoniae]|uniref:Uncharacterized protein n=1 Tax=Botrytis paeoniae TaxID=278948 RepID=A0A4Z1FWN8_9HELO|nr:hypothetical protein BPAE_0065g00050 [Botrytis paeoniae]